MKRTEWLQETRKMRFEEAYGNYKSGSITQDEAAKLLGVCDRTFRRYMNKYDEGGLDALLDKRLTQASHRCAPVDEVMRLTEQYRNRYSGWNARHFHAWYCKDGGTRSYTWVKSRLQEAGLIKRTSKRGAHRKRRERSPLTGMMIHQDGSTHEWVANQKWDLIVTMDDATSEHYSMFFVQEEGTASSFRGVQAVIEKQGLFCSFYSDRGSHYWHTPEAGGKVDKHNLTQFGQAMKRLGIEMIAAYSPQARGRSERMFRTHQERLPKELALAGIADMETANRYLQEVYMPAFNDEFKQPAAVDGSAFVPWIGGEIEDFLCERHERVVGHDNCVSFNNLKLQIPANQHRCHYVKAKVTVLRYPDGKLAILHGPRKIAQYDKAGQEIKHDEKLLRKSAATASQ
ncbi:MAG: ISNCY family transposase [Burkholderiales bacterium]|nr:ISNCY family transposase [Burkholderiales bacterium]MDR4516129.1 ISNCY family transposase [Nitrosomonas sp.]MCP5246223.1 ISNCY family transposase [Burkholderiales bacterium]MCP5246444.1 ISNCY family transposase [Burkholderiales bacterium]MDR4516385.1 ISNCY family transposase [Nitrosomonas sp.]